MIPSLRIYDCLPLRGRNGEMDPSWSHHHPITTTTGRPGTEEGGKKGGNKTTDFQVKPEVPLHVCKQLLIPQTRGPPSVLQLQNSSLCSQEYPAMTPPTRVTLVLGSPHPPPPPPPQSTSGQTQGK